MNRSESIKELCAALAKTQAQLTNPKKDTVNPFFNKKYADLSNVWDAIREPMTKNGLSITQLPSAEGNKVMVTGILMHESGEFISSEITLQSKDSTPQAIGSAITYARRYQISAMLGVAPEDDDGNDAQPKGKKEQDDFSQQERKEAETLSRSRRADLNKSLQACKTVEEFNTACKQFAKLTGRGIWEQMTWHNDTETFKDLAASHKERIEAKEDREGPEGQKEWREKMAKCKLSEFSAWCQSYENNAYLHGDQANSDALSEKAKEFNYETWQDFVDAASVAA